MLPARKFYGQHFMPDFFTDFFDNITLEGASRRAPAVNVMEEDNRYVLEIAVPGMKKDDFKVHINKDGNLVVEIEKKCDCQEEKKGKYIRREFSCSKFHHTLILPDNIDRENIEANVENGILYFTLPKVLKAKTEDTNKTIEVK